MPTDTFSESELGFPYPLIMSAVFCLNKKKDWWRWVSHLESLCAYICKAPRFKTTVLKVILVKTASSGFKSLHFTFHASSPCFFSLTYSYTKLTVILLVCLDFGQWKWHNCLGIENNLHPVIKIIKGQKISDFAWWVKRQIYFWSLSLSNLFNKKKQKWHWHSFTV